MIDKMLRLSVCKGEIMKNVYFIQANNIYGTDKKSTYIPYAAGCIQAFCQKNTTINNEYRFGKIVYSRENISSLIQRFNNPYMVLFSCSVWNMEYNKAVAIALKKAYPECYITFGGHSVPPDGDYLEQYKYIDFLTHRFGEEPTEGLLEALATGNPLENVPNLSFRNGKGDIITTEYVPQTRTDYPSPYLEGVFDDILTDDISFSAIFETNRGCPNSCSFCDWGSLKSRVRLFSMERVLSEIDWFVKNQIEFIYCADGNFCLFERDKKIADYIIECKQKYNYPYIFRVCFTKNKFDSVFEIGTKFFKHGLDKAQTLSFQSFNPETLANVGRKNISIELFRNLMKRYNEINISTFSELILGLPGETYESFCEGIGTLIRNGQHFAINIYPCELLPNAEMGQKEYKDKFKIKSTKVPFKLIHSNVSEKKDDITEYSEFVTSTFSMSEKEWAKALLFSAYIQGLHNLGLLRAIAIYCYYEYEIDYIDFYKLIIRESESDKYQLLHKLYSKIESLCNGVLDGKNELVATCDGLSDVLWGFDELIFLECYKNLAVFFDEIKDIITHNIERFEKIDSLFEYQQNIIKRIGSSEVIIESEYDFYSYFNRIYLNEYKELEEKRSILKITDKQKVSNINDFAREVVWYGRNKRATDYTSNNYMVEII